MQALLRPEPNLHRSMPVASHAACATARSWARWRRCAGARPGASSTTMNPLPWRAQLRERFGEHLTVGDRERSAEAVVVDFGIVSLPGA